MQNPAAPAHAPAIPGNGAKPVPPTPPAAVKSAAPSSNPSTQPPATHPTPEAKTNEAPEAHAGTAKAANPTTTEALLARIATALERLAVNTPAPNYKRGLANFKSFDFARLGIRAVKSDADGPSVLEWNNHFFTRRAGKGKFGTAVWFSRPIGKGEGEDEECRFERLITFKDYSEAESLPAEAKKNGAA